MQPSILPPSTKDYAMFKGIASNRPKTTSAIKRLCANIRKKNLLHVRPIIVNERLEVIDGQHRLKAAELLNVEIYYMLCPGLTKGDMAILNTAQKNWSGEDFVNFFATENEAEYVRIQDLMNEHRGLRLSDLIYICGGKYHTIKKGELKLPDYESALALIAFIEKVRNGGHPFVYDRDFIRAAMDQCSTEYRRLRFLNRFNKKNFHYCLSVADYKTLLIELIDKTQQELFQAT